MSLASVSVAAWMTAPTLVSAALFSATLRVAVAEENTGALLVATPSEPTAKTGERA